MIRVGFGLARHMEKYRATGDLWNFEICSGMLQHAFDGYEVAP
jgi:hypothetical protein